MNTYKFKWTRLQTEIFRFLAVSAGKRFNLRGIARALKVSPTAVSNSLSELEKDELIKVEKSKTMNLFLIEFNRDSQRAISLKRVENLRTIYESGLSDFLEDGLPGTTIILFGSYSRGDDIFSSDVDIAVIGAKEKELDLEKKFNKVIKNFVANVYKIIYDAYLKETAEKERKRRTMPIFLRKL